MVNQLSIVAIATIMQETKQHSMDLKDTIVRLYCARKGYRAIGKELHLHPCTVGSIVCMWKQGGLTRRFSIQCPLKD